jgi:hypothetical protein
MKLKNLKVLSLSLLVLGMSCMSLVQAGKPQDVRNGVHGHRIAIWDPDSFEFAEDEATYILYGWYYAEGEREDFPMPVKMEVYYNEIELKVFRFTRQLKQEGALSPTFYFYVLFDPYFFDVGESSLDVYLTFQGEQMLHFPHDLNVLPVDVPT